MSSWVDKYKPLLATDVVGQSKNVSRIKSWLKTYEPSRSRPLFIYGPPGIGKTTAVHLCCKEVGYKTVEFNASDQRNKNVIKETISTLGSNSRLNFFGRASETKDAIILDEIDGMAGNEDRGGIGQLIIEIKHSKKPMIFICNDGQHQKLRSLKDKCEVLEFKKPEYAVIKHVVEKIAKHEGLRVDSDSIRNLAESSDYDIRQVINSLSLFKGQSMDQIVKTTRLNAFEATKKALTDAQSKLEDRFEFFFSDYNIMSLFMYENYIKSVNSNLKSVSSAIDAICLSDLAEKEIRTNQNWSLLNTQALLSTVIPSKIVCKPNSINRVDFPQFLGKLSNTNKRARLMQELNAHMCLTLRSGLDADYLDVMSNRLSGPMIRKDALGGIDASIDFMHEYCLLRDDFNSIMELSSWSFKESPMNQIDTKTKTSFTLALKKNLKPLPYFVEETKVVKRTYNSDDEEVEAEEEVSIKPKRVIKNKASSNNGNSNNSSNPNPARNKRAEPAKKPAACMNIMSMLRAQNCPPAKQVKLS